MKELNAELQGLQNLDQNALDDAQKARLAELPGLIAAAEKTEGEQIKKDLDSALAQKEHFRKKFEKEEADRKALEARLNAGGGDKSKLDVGDYIDISASLEGLDQREKEKLAKEHKLTGQSLTEIRKSEDFILWQSAYKADAEKRKAVIPPSGKQPDSDTPISLEKALGEAQTLEEKEKLLQDSLGYSVVNKPRSDRVILGR